MMPAGIFLQKKEFKYNPVIHKGWLHLCGLIGHFDIYRNRRTCRSVICTLSMV